jgi:shikimate kinase
MRRRCLNRTILIIGPAGIGKTSVGRCLESGSAEFAAVKLDQIAADYWSKQGAIPRREFELLVQCLWPSLRLLAAGLDALRNHAAHHADRTLIVELGSVFQSIPSAVDLWRTFDVVALVAPPEAAYQRFVAHSDERISFDEYALREFSLDRRRVYDSAQHQIDTARKTMEESAEDLANVIRTIISHDPAGPGLVGPDRPWRTDR